MKQTPTTPASYRDVDVLIIGAGASGIPAAIAAARAGARVILLEEDAMVGGAAVDQYVSMPDGGPRSGIVKELVDRLSARFSLTPLPVDKWWEFWYLPTDYYRVVSDMLAAEPNIEVLCGVHATTVLVRDASPRPVVEGVVISTNDGEQRITARVTIDATGTGEIAVRAGCRSMYGEDARNDFVEDLAPVERTTTVQLCTWQYISQRMGDGPAFDLRRLQSSGVLESGYGWYANNQDGAVERNSGTYLHWGCRIACP
ncbi:MAG TPA: FAD-dependent oxidoreductase, partial [Armatimonadota bacterium]|nr:FAD-dependent oxidoreductase [Armatimonadota bacterium]